MIETLRTILYEAAILIGEENVSKDLVASTVARMLSEVESRNVQRNRADLGLVVLR